MSTVLTAQLDAVPAAAKVNGRHRQLIIQRVLRQVQALWGNRIRDPVAWLAANGEIFDELVAQAQSELVILAADTIDTQLEAQGYGGPFDLTVEPEAFAGVSGDGRPTMGLAYAASTTVALAENPSTYEWSKAGASLLVAVQTALSDTSREAKKAQLSARRGAGWIRIVRPPCCARCAILAGKKAQGPWVGFQRHPGCDCDAVAVHDYRNRSAELAREGWHLDANEYFDSLTTKEQDRIFTKAGAQAIRDGADPTQVINARRGMTTVTDRFRATTQTTWEGTSKRGNAFQYLRAEYGKQLVKRGKYTYHARPRLMPEEIYKISNGDPDETLNLLYLNGYLTDTSPKLSGIEPRDAEVRAARIRILERLLER